MAKRLDKYGSRVYGNHRSHRGGSNISPHGEVNTGSNLRGCIGGNSCTDPKNTITKIEKYVRINGEFVRGHYDVRGLPVKGPIIINNMRINDNEGKLVDKLQLVALKSNVKDDEWFNEKKALLVDEYIEKQEEYRIKRGNGFVYEHSFFKVK